MTKSPIVTVRDLSLSFPADDGFLEVLSHINLTLEKNEFVCIIGPSGSGKSTLLRALAGVLPTEKGEILFPCKSTMPTRALVFQSSNLLPWMKVVQNVSLPLVIHGEGKKEADQQARQILDRVGLSDFADEFPQNLSGGMKQRVAIARALIQQPELLLLDEPFGALDALTRDQMGIELMRTWEAFRPAVVMVTHSLSEAILLADRVLVFSRRPGTILNEIKVSFPRPRTAALRDEPSFLSSIKQLRGLIQEAA